MNDPQPPAPPSPRPAARAQAREGAVRVPGAARGASRLSSRVRRRGGRGALLVFVLVNAVIGGAAAWWFTRPQEVRDAALEKFAPGVGGRAMAAGVAFGLLVVLAMVVLPGARAALVGLSRAQHWFRTRPLGLRVLLFPFEAATGLLWVAAQCLFAIDAVGILVTAAAFLLYVVRIAKPELFAFLPGPR